MSEVRVFDDDVPRSAPRSGADWERHRQHRLPHAAPPPDEVGVPASSSFVLARGTDVAVAVRGLRALSDGLVLQVAVLFADEHAPEDVAAQLQEFSRSRGRFRLGVVFDDGSRVTTGGREHPDLAAGTPAASLVLLHARATPLQWEGEYWLWPLPRPGTLYVACRWPDRGIDERVLALDAGPLLVAAGASTSVWEDTA